MLITHAKLKRFLGKLCVAAWLAALCALGASEAMAARRVIYDAETHTIIHALAAPLLKAADLDPAGVDIVVIVDPDINAFVAGGPYIFINTGLILAAKNVGQVMGVLAHEIGHLRSGDVLRTLAAAAGASKAAVLSMILGAAGSPLARGRPAQRSCMVAARRPPAPFWLSAAGRRRRPIKPPSTCSPKPGNRRAAFMTSWPSWPARRPCWTPTATPTPEPTPIAETAWRRLSGRWPRHRRATPPPPHLAAGFARLRAKLTAYLQSSTTVRRRYPASNQSFAARYARAIAAHRAHQTADAVAALDGLIAGTPEDPFLLATRGAFQLDSGDAAGAEASYRAALRLAAALPETARAILTRDLAAALLAGNSAIKDREARDLLRPIAPWAGDSPGYWRQRAIAHGRLGEVGAATLAHGEAALRRGRLKEAHDLAARARRQLTVGTPEHLRALDIENAARNQLETR